MSITKLTNLEIKDINILSTPDDNKKLYAISDQDFVEMMMGYNYLRGQRVANAKCYKKKADVQKANGLLREKRGRPKKSLEERLKDVEAKFMVGK